MTTHAQPQILHRADKPDLAYHYYEGANADLPAILFCGGYKSDMNGTKATFLENFCMKRGQSFLRFDYRGHGASGGAFEDSTISDWRDDAADMIDIILGDKPLIIIGSSMGGWVALLLAVLFEKTAPEKIRALIGIAAAPDFTARLWDEELSDEQRQTVMATGRFEAPNEYSDEPYIFTKKLFDDGIQNLLLKNEHSVKTPMTLLQGKRDADVPWQTAHQIERAFIAAPVKIIMIEDGDHRLSREQDLAALADEIIALS